MECTSQIHEQGPKWSQYVTGWTWKHEDCDRLCPQISPDTGSSSHNCRGVRGAICNYEYRETRERANYRTRAYLSIIRPTLKYDPCRIVFDSSQMTCTIFIWDLRDYFWCQINWRWSSSGCMLFQGCIMLNEWYATVHDNTLSLSLETRKTYLQISSSIYLY
jgi:hypothetical protein